MWVVGAFFVLQRRTVRKVVVFMAQLQTNAAGLGSRGNIGGVEPSCLPLVPSFILVPLWFISLALPNLVYSGVFWNDTLHIVKWAVAGLPVGVAAVVAGIRLVLYGKDRINFKIDLFGLIWLGLLAYTLLQGVWVPISSQVSFVHEFICFAAVWGFYILSWNSFPSRSLRPLLWLANINAVINVIFAELQIRNLNGFTSLILPTPGNYIGNTGQQNMFGLWMALCIISSVYLYIAYATTPSGKKRHPVVTGLNLLIMAVNTWGLFNSTSRSAIFSLFVGLTVLAFITIRQFGREYAERLVHVIVLFGVVLGLTMVLNHSRALALVEKTVDMVENSQTYGGRDGIWATSRTMVKMQPWAGVGIGQYKWHYLEAQKEMFKEYPEKSWQYTHWAHNEFLQWLAEGGIVGAAFLLGMWGLWGACFLLMLWRKEQVTLEVIWACSLIMLITFNAQWTRPFHRIENILWLSLAFAISGKDMIQNLLPAQVFSLKPHLRLCGVFLLIAGLGGMAYLIDGMVGDRAIRRAASSSYPEVQRRLLEEASGHWMVRNEALKQLGYYYMYMGERSQNIQLLGQGFRLLWDHFQKEPHSEELRILIDWAQRFQNIDMMKTLAGYMKPGTFELRTQKNVIDSNNNVVEATILVPAGESSVPQEESLASEEKIVSEEGSALGEEHAASKDAGMISEDEDASKN